MSNRYPEAICDPSITVELTAAGIFLDAALSHRLRTARRTMSSIKNSAWAHLGQSLSHEECPLAYGTKAQLPVARPPTVEVGHQAHWAEMPGANRGGNARSWMPCPTSWFMEVRMEGEILSSALFPKSLAIPNNYVIQASGRRPCQLFARRWCHRLQIRHQGGPKYCPRLLDPMHGWFQGPKSAPHHPRPVAKPAYATGPMLRRAGSGPKEPLW